MGSNVIYCGFGAQFRGSGLRVYDLGVLVFWGSGVDGSMSYLREFLGGLCGCFIGLPGTWKALNPSAKP